MDIGECNCLILNATQRNATVLKAGIEQENEQILTITSPYLGWLIV